MMLGKTRLLPVLIAAFVMALTPVLASADAGSKDARTALDSKIVQLIDEAPSGLSGGELVSWVARAVKAGNSDLVETFAGMDLEDLNHGRIVSAIARANNADEATTENEDDSANATEEERGKSAANKQHGKDQNQINSQVDEDDEEDEATTEDEDSGNKGQSQGQSQGSAHAQGPKK